MLGPNINLSEDTQVVLQELQERKIKWDRLKRMQPVLSILSGSILLLVIYMLYVHVIVQSGGQALVILDLLIANRLLCILLLVGITLFLYTSSRARDTEKAKSKYEELRMEVVDRLESSWLKDMKSEARDQISSFLSEVNDINIRYKN